MVYGNKFLWESLIFKKLEQLQNPPEVQLDEVISDKVSAKIDSTVPNEMRKILAKLLSHQLFITSKFQKKYSALNSDANSHETQGTGMVNQSGKKWKKRKNKNKQTNKVGLQFFLQIFPTHPRDWFLLQLIFPFQ